jgi:hypothetical protein
MPVPVVLGVAMIVLVSSATGAHGQLRMGFYAQSCPGVEQMVGDYVRQHVRRVPTIAAALLRLHFHECFVRVRSRSSTDELHFVVALTDPVRVRFLQGCDASIPAQLHRRQRGGEGLAAEPVAARLRLHRPRQDPRRGGVPRRGVLRRRPCAHRPGRGRRYCT